VTITEYVLIAAAVIPAIGALTLAIRERRKPELDAAQIESAIVNSESIKQEIKNKSDLSNARRDIRLLALEKWGFEEVRPWGRDVVVKFDLMADLLRAELWSQGHKEMPDIHLTPFPEMPPPQAL
jgi:hypothetical protein